MGEVNILNRTFNFESSQDVFEDHNLPPTVLVLEDDPFSQKLFNYIVSTITKSVHVRIASNFEEFEKLQLQITNLKLAILDINLNGEKTGLDALKVLLQITPETPCLMTTALPLEAFESALNKIDKEILVLSKPFRPDRCKFLIEGFLYL